MRGAKEAMLKGGGLVRPVGHGILQSGKSLAVQLNFGSYVEESGTERDVCG
jgi:hypothetical protein